MTSRRVWQRSTDSKSLWNYTLSPGWTDRDVTVLRKAVIHYGCGNWKDISKHFPNKTCGQLNLQTQRLFGQQSLAEFFRLHIDPIVIKRVNDKKENVQRKNGCVINTGNNMTVEERKSKREENKKLEIPKDIYSKIKVPIVYDREKTLTTQDDKIRKLSELYRCLYAMKRALSDLDLPYRMDQQIKESQQRHKQRTKDNSNPNPTNTDTDKDIAMKEANHSNNDKSSSDILREWVGAERKDTEMKEVKSSEQHKSEKKKSRKRKKPDDEDEELVPKSKRKRTEN